MQKRICSIEKCDRVVLARTFCSAHYSRWQNGTEMTSPIRVPSINRECAVVGCAKQIKALGFCGTHYWRFRTKGAPGDPVVKNRTGIACVVAECTRLSIGRGYCRMHYERLRKGRPLGGPKPQRRASGQGSFLNGYKVVTPVKGTSRLEHRIIMECLLERPLTRSETVHHCNGNRSDNRTDGPLVNSRSGNLELWVSSQPSGQRVSDVVAHAVEMLTRYAPDALAEPPRVVVA